MKNSVSFLRVTFFLVVFTSLNAQQFKSNQNFQERNPIYDYAENQLNNTDTIPGFDSKDNKLKVTGIIYQNDGFTPAENVILYIEQPDENGDYDLREENDKRYVYNRGWIKTDADGRYTFYTFVPGNDRQYNRLKEILPTVKESSKQEYEIGTFLFDDDPFLTKRCRRQIAKRDDITRIMIIKKENDLLIAERNIVLSDSNNSNKTVLR